MKNRRLIRKAMLISMMANVISTPVYADSVDEQLPVKTYKQEIVGISAGAVLGALIGGPPGFIIGAAGGTMIGRGFGAEQELKETQLALLETQQQLATARRVNAESRAEVRKDKNVQLASLQSLSVLDSSDPASGITDGFYMTVQFRTGSHTLEPHFREQLEKLAMSLSKMPSINITLQGFSDLRGDNTYNHVLSGKRVYSVMKVLLAAGIDKERVHAESHGESNPLSGDQDGESYSFDRRVLITLSQSARAS